MSVNELKLNNPHEFHVLFDGILTPQTQASYIDCGFGHPVILLSFLVSSVVLSLCSLCSISLLYSACNLPHSVFLSLYLPSVSVSHSLFKIYLSFILLALSHILRIVPIFPYSPINPSLPYLPSSHLIRLVHPSYPPHFYYPSFLPCSHDILFILHKLVIHRFLSEFV